MRVLIGFAVVVTAAIALRAESTGEFTESELREILRQEIRSEIAAELNDIVASNALHSPGDCNCCNCCNCVGGISTCCQTGFSVGVEAIAMEPHLENNSAYIFSPVVPRDAQTNSQPFDFSYDSAVRIMAVWHAADGWGIRGRYWKFDHDYSAPSFTTPPTGGEAVARIQQLPNYSDRSFAAASIVPNETISAGYSIQMEVIDLELRRQAHVLSCLAIFSCGARYAATQHDYIASITNNAGVLDHFVQKDQSFQGIGPSFSFELVQPTRFFSVFANARGSILFGDQGFVLADVDPNGFDLSIILGNGEAIAISELNLGVEWCHGPLFFRIGWEGQLWHDAGGAADTYSDIGLQGFKAGLTFHR